MNSNYFPVTHSVASVEALAELVKQAYDLPPLTDCYFLALGLNDTFLVQTAADKYILRVYQLGWRTEDDVLFELEYLQYLDGQGIAVSTPLVKKDGTTLLKINAPEGLRYAALFTFAPGSDLSYDGPQAEQNAQLYGQAVAKLHNASANFTSSHRRMALDLNHILEEPLAKVLPLLADRPDDYKFLEQTGQTLREVAGQILTDELERGLCHGDFHGGNASINTGQTITFYDFDCCGYGWRAYELAVFRWNADALMNGGLLWPAFLQGYQTHRPISERDLAAIPLLEFIREFWYLGLEAGRTRFVSRRRWNALATFEIANLKKLQEKYHLLP